MSRELPNLGLVCMTVSDEIRFKTITRTRLLKMPLELQQITLRELYSENARRLAKAIDFCARKGIRLYRVSSTLFPSSEEPPGYDVLEELRESLQATGERARQQGLRIVAHPDQFVVLSSDNPKVIENSITILRHQARVLDLLGQPRSPWAAMQIHGGKGGQSDRLVEVIGRLPEEVRSRIALENDEFAYSAEEILEVCRRAGVPMVFDAHHHLCNRGLDDYDDPSMDEFTRAAAATWPRPEWQLVHISNGREFVNDPRHSDFVMKLPRAFLTVPWIEVEAKNKEEAVATLRRRLAREGGQPESKRENNPERRIRPA